MAQSPTHKFGQIIGDVLEAAVEPCLRQFASTHGLYLDKKGSRPARTGKKVSWSDSNGNAHDLDFVLERGGTPAKTGVPVAFIETAWRRYTKHSRNKAQEIQGAIEPLAETYKDSSPFKGVVVAGVFTEGALNQLISLGYSVLYFRYAEILDCFRLVGIDASYDQDTPDLLAEQKVREWYALPTASQSMVAEAILKSRPDEVTRFLGALHRAVGRKLSAVFVLPLHGPKLAFSSISDAISAVQNYAEGQYQNAFVRYEIEVRFDNGDQIRGAFADRGGALDFLRLYDRFRTPLTP